MLRQRAHPGPPKAFKRGLDANNHPKFYRQLGKDPDQLTAHALEALAIRFKL
jgi:hypothetical protein